MEAAAAAAAEAENQVAVLHTTITNDSNSTHPLVLRLQETLNSCSKVIVESGDISDSESAIASLVELLDSVSDAVTSDPENEGLKSETVEILQELHRFICSHSLDQAVLDALSFVLPKSIAKFACVSSKGGEIVEGIIDHLVSSCNPRDMLSVICEALDAPSEVFKSPAYFVPLLSGLSKVFCSITRRQFEQIKVVVPIVLNVVKAVFAESDDQDDRDSVNDLAVKAIDIATSIEKVCQKLEGQRHEQLRALLGLYVLEMMALVSNTMEDGVSSCISIVMQLQYFVSFCGFSYLDLITGHDVDKATLLLLGVEDDNELMNFFPHIRHGATISVLWAYMSDEVANASKEDISALKSKLECSRTKRWKVIGMLKYVLSALQQPWELKKSAIGFLLYIFDGNTSQICDGEDDDCSSHTTSLFAALQAIERVMMYAPSSQLRKDAFCAIKRVLAEIPTYQRFDIYKALVTNSGNSSMIAIILDLVRKELAESHPGVGDVNSASPSSPFWSSSVLELVALVLRPPRGGPPSLPEETDAVLSALNLYRFIFITESKSITNYTEVLSESTLRKVYTEWLLPLRTLLTGNLAETRKDDSPIAIDIICGLNPIEIVLYRCIELVEDKLN